MLEWRPPRRRRPTTSPYPDREPLLEMKETRRFGRSPPYEDIRDARKNSAVGVSSWAPRLALGFAMVWHIWWWLVGGVRARHVG